MCYNSAIYFDAADTLTDSAHSQTYAASDIVSQGWHWGVSSTNASCKAQNTGQCYDRYEYYGDPWEESPWEPPGFGSDPGDGSGGDYDNDDGGGGSNTQDPEETEEEKAERLELYRRCMDKADGWHFNCGSNANINYRKAMDYCDSLNEYVENEEDQQDVDDCELDAFNDEKRELEECDLEQKSDRQYCLDHFGKK